jgi:hypothetical protein
MLGLLVFVWAFLRMQRTGRLGGALLAGAALMFAMFCRPMTAAGVALPFGLWLVAGYTVQGTGYRDSCIKTVGLGIPLLIGFVVMGWYNRELTGSVWVSPYQQYTDTYTPRHVYGFNNVFRGEKKVGPRVIEQYDRWAENLTPALALKNARERIIASGQWTLGLVPLAMALSVLAVPTLRLPPPSGGPGLLVASIVSLHLVHVPYWFVGIMHWHYVFESAPLLLVLTGVAADRMVTAGQLAGRRGPIWWGTAILAAAVLVNITSLEGVWTGRLWQGVSEVRFARDRHEQFRNGLRHLVEHRPAIVLVKPDPSDRHIDYVTNDPDLSGPVLIGRWLKDVPLSRVRELYPDRAVYLYDAQREQWQLLARP